MEAPLLNLVDSSFEHVLHLYGFHFVLTYKYEIGNFFDSIYYLLNNHLSYLELKQNRMTHLNQCLLLNTEKFNNVVFENKIQGFCLIIYIKA